jgi:uncharacterized glyoxalase superfamily protein PhnB
MAKSLPEQPNLEWLKKSAKEHLALLRAHNPDARLHEAQHAVAQEYGFKGWRALKSHVEKLSVDGRIVAAVQAGKAQELAELLDAHPRKLGITGGPWKAPLLHLAAEHGHLDCVKLLLHRGFDVHKRDRTNRATALHEAAAGGHLEIAKQLLAAGADIDGAGDAHRLGVIGWATCFKQVHTALAEFLLARGAKPTILSSVALGREDLVRQLVGNDRALLGTIEMSRFEHHRTPLHLAVLKNRPGMVRLLVELGADPSAKDNRGYTPLSLARSRTDAEIADILLAAGADPGERFGNRFEAMVPVLKVASLAASVDYYVDKLGFRKMWDWGDPATFASVRRDEVQIFLAQEEREGRTSLSIFVQDVDALYDDYRERGAAIRRPPTDLPWGTRSMDVDDPDGHSLRFSGDGGEENRSA